MQNQNYIKQLDFEYIGLKKLYNYLNAENMITLTLEEFIKKCIRDGIYDSKILNIMEDDIKQQESKNKDNNKYKNKWLKFVSNYSKENNISYKEAMTSEKAKLEYKNLN